MFNDLAAEIYEVLDAAAPWWRICEKCLPECRASALSLNSKEDPTDSHEE